MVSLKAAVVLYCFSVNFGEFESQKQQLLLINFSPDQMINSCNCHETPSKDKCH